MYGIFNKNFIFLFLDKNKLHRDSWSHICTNVDQYIKQKVFCLNKCSAKHYIPSLWVIVNPITTVHQFILASIQFRGKINVSPELNSHLDLFESNPVVFITFSAVLKKQTLTFICLALWKLKLLKWIQFVPSFFNWSWV